MSTFSGFIIIFSDKSYKKIFEKLTKNEVDKFGILPFENTKKLQPKVGLDYFT